MTTVAISGYFDPLHDMHLDYVKKARHLGDKMICIVGSNSQLLLKKGKFNIPEESRKEIVSLVLTGLGIDNVVVVNEFDTETTLIANALRELKPDILCRSGDKTPEDMPPDEVLACQENNIKVVYTEFAEDRHGSKMEVR